MQVQRLEMTTAAVSAKRCPQCGKAAMLEALLCPACGHRYRTRFAAPERTQAFDLFLVPPVTAKRRHVSPALRTFGLAFASSFALVALAGGLLWAGLDLRQPAPPRPHLATPAVVPAANRAGHLYGAIQLSMSLYDLAQAAGSTGQVRRNNDPHILLLAYDYPVQSVHVMLTRTDVTSDNYQVRSVALYQGRTLLCRRDQ